MCLVIWAGSLQAQAVPEDDPIIDLTPMFDFLPVPGSEPVPVPEPAPEPAPDLAPDRVGDVQPEPLPDAPVATPVEEPEVPPTLPAYIRGGASEAAEGELAGTPFLSPARSGEGVGVIRLTGEFSELPLTIDVPAVADVADLRIAYQSSINNLPGDSQLTAILNGTEIARIEPSAFDGFAVVSLPREGLVEGRNSLVIRSELSHRIFCGPEASFGIWTEIDLAQSGIEIARDSGLGSGAAGADAEDFRLAMIAQLAAGHAVPVVAASAVAPAQLADLRQRLAALLPGAMPELDVQSPYAPAPEEIAVARIAIVASAAPLAEIRKGEDGALILVISAEVDAPLLDVILPGLGAIAGPPAFLPGVSATLSEMGYPPISMQGHYGRTDLDFRLPGDWLLISSQRVLLDLLYDYAPGLPEGALMLVKVNGTTIRLLPLFGQGGETLPMLPVGFPAQLLAPGPNTLTFETIIPGDPPDLPCPRIEGPLLRVSGESALRIPSSPRMHFANVGAGLSELDPGAVVATPEASADGVAVATVQAIMLRLRPFAGAVGETRLTIAGVSELDRLAPGDLGLTRQMAETALAPPLPAPVLPAPVEAELTDLPATVPTDAASVTDRVSTLIAGLWQSLRELAAPGDPALPLWLEGRRGTAMLVMPDAASPDALWLLLGPAADPDTVARALAMARTDPAGPTGRLSLLQQDGTWQSWRAATTPPQLNEPLTIANFRTVVGNYASWSPLGFVIILAILMSISVILGLVFVVRTRGSRKR